MQLTLVGTGHIFNIGAIVETIIDTRQPDLVCVELDPIRLKGLHERKRLNELQASGDPRADEILRAHREATKRLPLLYRFMAKTQEKLATHEGVEAGSEMLAAVEAARARQLPVATIDVDAQQLIRRAWGQMRLKERLKFIWAMLRGQGPGSMEEELGSYQEDPVAYLAKVGEEFPTLKRVLIDERDAHMANALLGIDAHKERLPGSPETARVVAVVGDGHIPGILGILDEHPEVGQIEVIRVGALRSGEIPDTPFAPRHDRFDRIPGDDTGSVSFRVDVTGDRD